jgi:hypothetical protein
VIGVAKDTKYTPRRVCFEAPAVCHLHVYTFKQRRKAARGASVRQPGFKECDTLRTCAQQFYFSLISCERLSCVDVSRRLSTGCATAMRQRCRIAQYCCSQKSSLCALDSAFVPAMQRCRRAVQRAQVVLLYNMVYTPTCIALSRRSCAAFALELDAPHLQLYHHWADATCRTWSETPRLVARLRRQGRPGHSWPRCGHDLNPALGRPRTTSLKVAHRQHMYQQHMHA